MPVKTVPVSVRLSQRDHSFLATLDIEGATTLSEKIRSLIVEARQRQAGAESHAEGLAFIERLLAPPSIRLRGIEAEQGAHSELLLQVWQSLPDLMAFMMTQVPEADDEELDGKLLHLENGIADRVFVLFERVLRLGVTGISPCYDENVIGKRVKVVEKLSDLLKSATLDLLEPATLGSKGE